MKKLEAGEKRPLNVTDQGNRRVFVGLSWDPSQSRGLIQSIKEFFTGKKSYHDLDLSCFMYDADHNFVGVISGKTGQIVDQSGGIYHSGDDTEGAQDGDDEQISVELATIAPEIAHLIFKISIDSGHNFNEVTAPEVRLVDGYSRHHFIKTPLMQTQDKPKSAYLFVELYRSADNANQWNTHFIDTYKNSDTTARWAKKLQSFLTSPKKR